jgi:hypothetical protein
VTSAFAKYELQAWPYRYVGQLHVRAICGGTPSDPRVAEGWIRTKLGATSDDLIRQQVAEVMAERGISPDEAREAVEASNRLNGFKRDEHGLYIEGRQLKAAIKEAASVAGAAGKVPLKSWGKTNKGLLGFIAEHVAVVEDRLHLGVSEPSGIAQRFVHTFRGTGIQYEEYVEDAKIDFSVIADYPFTEEQWAMIWLTGGQQGIGATRSQGYGRYTITRWEQIEAAAA